MLRKLRERIETEEKGFTLIELLVVVLIIGILAAIAIPAFLGQREKAEDGSAKSYVRNAASAAEAFYSDNQTYAGMTLAALVAIEPSLNDEPAGDSKQLTISGLGEDTYSLSIESKTGNVFTISKDDGVSTRTCTQGGRAGCPESGATDTW